MELLEASLKEDPRHVLNYVNFIQKNYQEELKDSTEAKELARTERQAHLDCACSGVEADLDDYFTKVIDTKNTKHYPGDLLLRAARGLSGLPWKLFLLEEIADATNAIDYLTESPTALVRFVPVWLAAVSAGIDLTAYFIHHMTLEEFKKEPAAWLKKRGYDVVANLKDRLIVYNKK